MIFLMEDAEGCEYVDTVNQISRLASSHHAELRLRLLDHVLLLRLADAGENPRLRVVVQHVALEAGEEVAEAADAAQAHHTLAGKQERSEEKEE